MHPLRSLALFLATLSLAQAENRSAVVVTRALAPAAAEFSKLLTPRVEAQAGLAGLAVTSAALATDSEAQITAARSRGASVLIEIQVPSYTSTTVQILGQDRRRLVTSATWRALDISGNPESIGSGQASASSADDTLVAETEQASALADNLAEKIGKDLAAKLAAAPAKAVAPVAVTLRPVVDGFALPDIAIDAEGKVSRSENALRPALSGFTIEVDGVAVGTAGNEAIRLAPGIRQVTVSRSGYESWSKRVEVREGLVLEVALAPTAEALARIRAHTELLSGLAQGAKLNAAEVERIRAAAQALRNSGFKVDLKVDAKELPETVIVPPSR